MQESLLLGDGTTVRILGDGSTSCKFLRMIGVDAEVFFFLAVTVSHESSRGQKQC